MVIDVLTVVYIPSVDEAQGIWRIYRTVRFDGKI